MRRTITSLKNTFDYTYEIRIKIRINNFFLLFYTNVVIFDALALINGIR